MSRIRAKNTNPERTVAAYSQLHFALLVGLLNLPDDLKLARDKHWYRVPVESAHKWVGDRWPPMVLAFY